ncbi:hypothetical protein EH240_28575 [Mesorhizobium tamadayense]|uniref:Uncharacterized protein n=1 Tax=Mesorhizobium tamadayense TaxID=425306 RepID=A0A3P3F5I2_9HYPH|nr:hypothetical protein [Mesorhizobium tamadayense]RRH93904.1 hypothetical protein EH240_28575 [Mesorhizobium tamadayense]
MRRIIKRQATRVGCLLATEPTFSHGPSRGNEPEACQLRRQLDEVAGRHVEGAIVADADNAAQRQHVRLEPSLHLVSHLNFRADI